MTHVVVEKSMSHWSLVIGTLVLSLGGGLRCAQGAPSTQDRQLQTSLQRHVSVAWQGQSLGATLKRLAVSQQIAIWLDRRVDPQQRVEMRLTDARLDDVLRTLAERSQMGIAAVEGVVYFGPAQSVDELPALMEQARETLRSAPARVRRRWLQKAASEWPKLSEPRRLLAAMVASNGFRLLHGDQIAHDLWAARRLPPIAMIDRTVLLLIGFDLTCEITPTGDCKVLPIRRPLPISKSGTLDRAEKRRSAKGHTKASGHKVFSLRLKNQPLEAVVDQLAQQMGWKVAWDDRLTEAVRRQAVSCDVREVRKEELLESLLGPTDLQFEVDAGQLTIGPRE